ncbi:YHYH domain-containing protein [Niallia sp. FSL W8-0177]|uniref:YHYH domain-containing protein n=1 Tax=Niallia sp. FSL W8-0177 TaxID=2954522 RepID=UPI0030FC17F2
MRKYIIILLGFSILGFMVLNLSITTVEAHPGRTDANGGHTCRTNCEKWGLSYGEYHYHNGGSSDSTSSNTDEGRDIPEVTTVDTSSLENELSEARDVIEQYEQENKEVKQKIDNLEDELAVLNNTINKYKKREEEIDSRESSLSKKEKELEGIQVELDKREKEVEAKIRKSEENIKKLETDLNDKQEVIQNMENDTTVGAISSAVALGGGYGIYRFIRRKKTS